jgi:hypothetical protein
VPHFYFHLFNDMDVVDAEGVELPNAAAALNHAREEARTMICVAVHQGHLNLNHRIEIEDEAGNRTPMTFRDAFTITD